MYARLFHLRFTSHHQPTRVHEDRKEHVLRISVKARHHLRLRAKESMNQYSGRMSDVGRGPCHLADTQLDQVREQATHLTTVFSDPRIHARH